MNVYYSYGKLKSDSKKKEQTVYVRLFYGRNKIQVKASTQLVIQKHGWNFKKGEKAGVIDLLKGERTYEESQHFQEVQNKLDHIRNYLKAKSEGAELFLTKYDDYLKISSIDFSKNTIADYNSIRKKIVAFEQYKKRKYKTDEIDLLFYADFHEWCFGVSGIKTNTFGSYIAKIKAVINHFRTSETSFKFHVNIAHKKFKTLVDVHDYEILDTKELELLWSYKGKAYLENVRDISKFLYYICLRWNEFYYEFKERKGEHRIHTIEEENGKESYVWDIKESKVKARKEVPVHKVLLDMWKGEQMPYYISAQKFNDYIKELCKEVGIKKYKSISSHCTNMRNAKHDEKYIIEYSGHTTVKALKNYISKKHTNKDNTIPTK